jgi:hypothetical protein
MATEIIDRSAFSYEIRLKNHLETHWGSFFEGWSINNLENGEVLISISSIDQAGLHGVLNKIRDLNLTLISVEKISNGN